mmetsp:Transcript_44373/g.110395  ORF Transcript_44373/g.110395 Transcript_44373/m.110395 type:complete len:215 (-) Transcript_44373:484-1128(-)
MLAVEEQKVHKRLRWERRIGDEEVELLEAVGGLRLHIHQRCVVQRDGIEFFLRSGRHVGEGLARRVVILHLEFNGCLQVESLDERCLLQDKRIPDGTDIDAFGLRPHTKFRVLAYTTLDDFCNQLERRAILLLLVMAQPDRVSDFRLEPHLIHRLCQHTPRLLIQSSICVGLCRLLEDDARLVDQRVWIIWRQLVDESLRVHEVVLLVSDGRLQ